MNRLARASAAPFTRPLRRSILIAAAILAGVSSAFADSPPTLRFDPFRTQPEASKPGVGRESRSPAEAFEPILQSTVLGERGALAVLGGVVLEVGEATHGYRLIEVKAFEATFEKDGETLHLEVASKEGTSR